MDETPGAGRLEGPRYEIRLEGTLGPRGAARFEGLSVEAQGDGTTRLHGEVVDQAALHGLLQKVRDLGLPLVSVRRTDLEHPDRPRQSTGAGPDHPTRRTS